VKKVEKKPRQNKHVNETAKQGIYIICVINIT
jgi:hypothetical protein